MKDALLKAFESYLDRKATDQDMEKGFTFACGFAAGQESAKSRRELKLLAPSEEVKRYMDGIEGVLEANNYETLAIWRDAKEHKHFTFEQERNGGYLVTIARAEDGTVICLSIQLYRLDDKKILVIEPTSRYVDYELVDKWLKKHIPDSAYKDETRINKTDAMNVGNLR